MLEKDFEEIICKYPDLIEDGLTFKGNQVYISGKYVDMIFKDRYGQELIVELKRGTVVRKDIAQLLEYEGYFVSPDNPTTRVMLVGNRIPKNLKLALDHHGFEWREITISQLTKYLKNKRDHQLLVVIEDVTPESKKKAKVPALTRRSKRTTSHSQGYSWDHHKSTDQGGRIDNMIKKGKSIDEIVVGFKRRYPKHQNPKGRVKRHIDHLIKEHSDFPYILQNGKFERVQKK